MTNSFPKISIVTPSFNQGDYLEECIDSVLSQNYPNLEYIIMDGGSRDKSVDIIKKYEKYVTYWQSQPDGGQYAAIDDGFKMSSGEIMAWLNSDDKYHRNAFYKVAYTFTTYHHLEWIVGRPSFWDNNGELASVNSCLPVYSRLEFLKGNYSDPCIQQESTFWRRSLWEKSGGYLRKELEYAGDLELWLRFFRFAHLQTVDALLGGYRSHANQKTALYMDKYVAEAEKVLDEEIVLSKRLQGASASAPLESLSIPADDVIKYMGTACVEACIDPLKIVIESEKVTECLLRQLNAASAELDTLLGSYSWRLTKPLRWFRSKFEPGI